MCYSSEVIANVYRERFDSSTDIVTIAEDTWVKSQFQVEDKLHHSLYDGEWHWPNNQFAPHLHIITIFALLIWGLACFHPCDEVRHSASKALSSFLKTHPNMIESTIGSLLVAYQDYVIPTPALMDNLGRLLQEEIDRWEARCGIGLAIREIAKEMSPETVRS